MDKMAYLQQIASENSKNHQKSTSGINGFDISKFLTPKNILIFVVSLFFFIGFVTLLNTKKSVDTRDRDLLIRSYFMSKYLKDQTIASYGDLLKSSDLRGYATSLKSVLNELILSEKNSLTTEFGIEDLDSMEEGAIGTEEKNKNLSLNEQLETARLSAHLDRVFVRELSLQLTYLISYQSEINERTQKTGAKAATETEIKNLTNLKNNFDKFNIRAV